MSTERTAAEVLRVIPPGGKENLIGLYLKSPTLAEIAEKLNRPIVICDYVTDINGIIAIRNPKGIFIPPPEITNPYDWRLFQELTAQADAIMTSGKYLNGYAKGRTTQNILTQYESGGKFSQLGVWRLEHGYDKKSPDLIVPSRSLNITIPDVIIEKKRKILIYTTGSKTPSQEAKTLKESGADLEVVNAGNFDGTGIDGGEMVKDLKNKGYRVVNMATGPSVLKILLDAYVLDRIYITEVQREVAEKNPENFKTVLANGGEIETLPGFSLVSKVIQNDVKVDDGTTTSQHFLIFESDRFKAARDSKNISV